MDKGIKKRDGWRRHNSNFKPLLQGLGMRDTSTKKLKEWLSFRTFHTTVVEGDERPVKVVYDNMVGAFETWAEACYHVAVIERKKGKRI